jgi:hypothetical protein
MGYLRQELSDLDVDWLTITRPGYFGSRRNQILKKFDSEYGKGNYRIRWRVLDKTVPLEVAIAFYEDAYYELLRNETDLLLKLVATASNIYDNHKSNLSSGFDYARQENHSNHYQDIAVRKAVLRLGREFGGRKLIQIRHSSPSKIGRDLSPGRVPFHLPNLIIKPRMKGWWQKDSVEDFWQSNKVLQVRRKIANNGTR